jgi:ubiquinone/menaquinone biosynthesis C-methylase UbiE
MRRPSKSDVSKPKVEEYAYKKEFYRDTDVAAEYDKRRFTTPARQRRNLRKWRAIQKALAETTGVHTVLDLPCGTGRFTGDLARQGYLVVGSDISFEMMRQAAVSPDVAHEGIVGYVDADAEGLPFRNASLDCIVSIRFMFHVDPTTRRRILREMGRVSKRWLIVDYRHRYTARWVLRQLRYSLGLISHQTERVSRRGLRSEFHDAGLTILRVISVHSWMSDKWIVLAEATHDDPALDPDLAEMRLKGTELEGARISGVLGEGRRSTVYRASWRGRDVALKVYKKTAIASHARKNTQPIAEFEYSRNLQFYSVKGLERYVAQPYGFAVTPEVQAIAQESVEGPLYYFYYRQRSGDVPASLADHLGEILRLSHEAELYDVDLHAMNVLVTRDASDELVPKLFDFNLIPFTLRPQNPFVGSLLKMGLLSKESRDLRRLRRFHDFRHIENRLLKFHNTNT